MNDNTTHKSRIVYSYVSVKGIYYHRYAYDKFVNENLPDNLWQWIKPLKRKNKNENICFSNIDANYSIRKKLSATGKDIFRHSFGSYAYHFLGAEKAIEIIYRANARLTVFLNSVFG